MSSLRSQVDVLVREGPEIYDVDFRRSERVDPEAFLQKVRDRS